MQNFSNLKNSNLKKTLEFLHKNEEIKNAYLNCKNPKSRIDFLRNCKDLNLENITQYLTNEVRKELLRNMCNESKLDINEHDKTSIETHNSKLESTCKKNTTSTDTKTKDFNSKLQTSIFDSDSSISNKSGDTISNTSYNEKLIDSSEPKEIVYVGSETLNYQKEIDRLSASLNTLKTENSELKEVINSFTHLYDKTTELPNENENSLDSNSLKEFKQIATLRSFSSQKTDVSISTDLIRKATMLFIENKIIDPNNIAIENINPYSLITETILLKFINQNSFL